MNKLLTELTNIIKECALTDSEVVLESRFKEDLGMTSFSMFMTIVKLEMKYSMRFEYDELLKFVTVNDVYMVLQNKLMGKHNDEH